MAKTPETWAPSASTGGKDPKPGGAKPFVLVAPPAFTDAARQLVTSAIRNAKNEKNEATRNAKALSELQTTADKLKSR